MIFDWKSDISSKELRGGTKTVEREPLALLVPLVRLVRLSIERIVRIDPVGERVTEDSGSATGRLTASLQAG